MSQLLFRGERPKSGRSEVMGGARRAQPLRGWLLVVATLVATVAIMLFLYMASYTRRSTVSGELVPSQGLVTVVAPASGTLAWLGVPEGSSVAAGDSVALVSTPSVVSGTDAARMAWAAGKPQQGEVPAGALAQELLAARQQAVILEHAAQLRELQQHAASARRLLTQLQQTLAVLSLEGHAQDTPLLETGTLLGQARLQVPTDQGQLVKAPVAGIVAARLVKPGQSVQIGQELLHLLPGDGQLEAELWATGSAVGSIEPGDELWLRYRAFPHQKFGRYRGYVTAVSGCAVSATDGGGAGIALPPDEPRYRITVQLGEQVISANERQQVLRAGMQLEAEVMGERRRLIEWLFAPMQSLAGRLARE